MQSIHIANEALFRLASQLDEMDVGIDPEFDNAREEIEREFAEIRLHVGSGSHH